MTMYFFRGAITTRTCSFCGAISDKRNTTRVQHVNNENILDRLRHAMERRVCRSQVHAPGHRTPPSLFAFRACTVLDSRFHFAIACSLTANICSKWSWRFFACVCPKSGSVSWKCHVRPLRKRTTSAEHGVHHHTNIQNSTNATKNSYGTKKTLVFSGRKRRYLHRK